MRLSSVVTPVAAALAVVFFSSSVQANNGFTSVKARGMGSVSVATDTGLRAMTTNPANTVDLFRDGNKEFSVGFAHSAYELGEGEQGDLDPNQWASISYVRQVGNAVNPETERSDFRMSYGISYVDSEHVVLFKMPENPSSPIVNRVGGFAVSAAINWYTESQWELGIGVGYIAPSIFISKDIMMSNNDVEIQAGGAIFGSSLKKEYIVDWAGQSFRSLLSLGLTYQQESEMDPLADWELAYILYRHVTAGAAVSLAHLNAGISYEMTFSAEVEQHLNETPVSLFSADVVDDRVRFGAELTLIEPLGLDSPIMLRAGVQTLTLIDGQTFTDNSVGLGFTIFHTEVDISAKELSFPVADEQVHISLTW